MHGSPALAVGVKTFGAIRSLGIPREQLPPTVRSCTSLLEMFIARYWNINITDIDWNINIMGIYWNINILGIYWNINIKGIEM